MFEKAAKLKLRFDTTSGPLSVEDLWDLPLTSTKGKANLDDIARGLHKQLKSGDDVSFVVPTRKSDETIQLKFDLVKHVIDARLAENQAALLEKERADKKQRIMGIIAAKQDETLQGMSLDDLKKLMSEL
jgi:hypothetical protein